MFSVFVFSFQFHCMFFGVHRETKFLGFFIGDYIFALEFAGILRKNREIFALLQFLFALHERERKQEISQEHI